MTHPVLKAGRVAVVTGAAMGIGFAACRRFAGLGMKVCMADVDREELQAAHARLVERTPEGEKNVLAVPADVARAADLEALRNTVYERFGEVGLLMNNAASRTGGGVWAPLEDWHVAMDVNFWGVVHGVRAFVPRMIEQRTAMPGGQHRLQAGHHQSARQHRLQHHQVGAEDLYRRLGARAAQYGGLPGQRPPPGAGLDDDRQARAQTRRLAAGPGDRRAGGSAWSAATSTSSVPTTT